MCTRRGGGGASKGRDRPGCCKFAWMNVDNAELRVGDNRERRDRVMLVNSARVKETTHMVSGCNRVLRDETGG